MEGYGVDWQLQQNKISDRAQYILKNCLWTDCKFIVGDEQNKKEFKAHQLFLSMSSPVFEKMFKGVFLEQTNDIHIVDIQPEAFGAMLNYVYSDELEIQSFDQACELCYVANKYMMQNLLKRCTAYVLKDINVSNACRGYEFAKLFDQHELMEKCKEVICKRTAAILTQPSFLDAQISTVKMILDEKKLNASEYELFEAVETWTKAEFSRNGIEGEDHKSKQQIIYDQLVPKICFLNMSAKGFADRPALSSMLKPEDSFAILLNLTTSNCTCPLPKGFSTTLREACGKEIEENIFLSWHCDKYRREFIYLNDETAVSFSCNKDIKIAGVMVIGQDPPLTQLAPGSCYQESLEVYLHDWTNSAKHITKYNATIEYRKLMHIYFPHPIKMSKGKAYNLGVKIKQAGVYTGGVLDTNEIIYKSFKFNFMENPFILLISGIIFSE